MRQRRHGHVRQRSAGTWEIRYTRGTDRCEGDIRKNSEDNSDVGSSHPIRGTGPEAHHSKRTSLTYLYRAPLCIEPCAPSRGQKRRSRLR
jgi:hypothetical protein